MNRTALGFMVLLGAFGMVAASKAISKGRDQPRASASVVHERQVDDGRLEREMQALRREVALLRAARTTQESPVAPSSAEPSAPAPPRAPPSAEDLDQSRVEHEARVSVLASRMDAEPHDRGWSRATEQRLAEALRREPSPGTALVSVDCRSTMCGATFRHDDAQGQKAVPHLIVAATPHDAEMVYEYAPDGATTTVYISREGARLAER